MAISAETEAFLERSRVIRGMERGLVERAEVGDDGLVRGTASTVCNMDRMDRVLLPGAWQAASWTVPFLLNHKDDTPLGQTTFSVTRDGQLSHTTEIVGDPVQPGTGVPIRELLRKGYPATSIGWLPKRAYLGWNSLIRAAYGSTDIAMQIWDGQTSRAVQGGDPKLQRQIEQAKAMGVEQSNSARYFADVEVVENSLVPIPANPRALLEAASLLPPSDERAELEAMVEFAAGARHSSSDQAIIQRLHDDSVTLGAACTETTGDSDTFSGASDSGPATPPLPSDSGIKGGWHDHMHSSYQTIEQTLRDLGVADSEFVASQLVDLEIGAAAQSDDQDDGDSKPTADDPDGDGDDDTTPEGDTDHDNWTEAGKPKTKFAMDHLKNQKQKSAAMSSASINDLPDSDFAYIEPGGTKDSDGKTTPRSLRHFPIHDATHVRNDLARAPQSPFGDKAMPKIRAAAKKFGIEVSENSALDVPLEVAKAGIFASIGAIERELGSLD